MLFISRGQGGKSAWRRPPHRPHTRKPSGELGDCNFSPAGRLALVWRSPTSFKLMGSYLGSQVNKDEVINTEPAVTSPTTRLKQGEQDASNLPYHFRLSPTSPSAANKESVVRHPPLICSAGCCYLKSADLRKLRVRLPLSSSNSHFRDQTLLRVTIKTTG